MAIHPPSGTQSPHTQHRQQSHQSSSTSSPSSTTSTTDTTRTWPNVPFQVNPRERQPERSYSTQTIRGGSLINSTSTSNSASFNFNSNGNGNVSQSSTANQDWELQRGTNNTNMPGPTSTTSTSPQSTSHLSQSRKPINGGTENYVNPYNQGDDDRRPSQTTGQGQGTVNGTTTTNGTGNLSWGAPFPSLHLWPLNETFVMKMIHLPPNQKIKIGRQTNAKTAPGERNGYFDSKVLSRMHADVWEQDGKIYIKDVKSSNGTFINGDRLSAEGVESEPFELKSEDQVEFGIDIVSEDNKTVVHRKVAAKAYCVFNVDDAGMSARELTQYFPHDPRQSQGPIRRQPGMGSSGSAQQGMGMSYNVMSAGGKTQGLNFDHVLHKLQTELQKSRETGQELQSLTTAMTDIQDTLSGGMPPSQNGVAPQYIPPQFRGSSGVPDAAMGDTSATIAALQAQLNTTQSILVSHKDRIRSLEALLAEHEAIKDEVMKMRESMEQSKRDIEMLLIDDERSGGEDDDTESVMTARPGDEEVPLRRKKKGGKSDVVVSNLTVDHAGVNEEDIADGGSPQLPPNGPSKAREEEIIAQNTALSARIEALGAELEEALQLSRFLKNQHAESTSTVKILETRIQALEKDVATRVVDASGKAGRAAEDRWEAWRTKFEESWKKERESWDLERERLKGVVREWEEASRRAQEEEEERLMNEQLSGEGEEESDEETWLGDISTASDPGPGGDYPSPNGAPLSRTQSASPRSTSRPVRRSRRESSSRLDPAIRALRAAAGEDPLGSSVNGRTTPMNASSTTATTADGALDALRIRSARAKRAGTITRKRMFNSATPTAESEIRRRLGTNKLGKTSSSVTVKGLSGLSNEQTKEKETCEASETHSNSTESDETAHEDKRGGVSGMVEDGKVKEKQEGGTMGGPIKLGVVGQHPIPLAVSIAILGVAAWAIMHRAKE